MGHSPKAAKIMSINPDIITWARERAGYKPGDERILKQFPKLETWERGDARPTYPQLERLADKLKVPVSVFFFPERPNVPDIKKSFRTLDTTHFDEIPPKVQLLLRKARAFQIGLEELNLGRNQAQNIITQGIRLLPTDTVDSIAKQVRIYLGVTFEEQFEWKNADTALKEWRKSFLNAGIYVFKDAFGQENNEYCGFSLHDTEFPIVYVNNSHAKTRQIFTLFHELAHLLFHTSGIDTRSDDFISALSSDHRRIEILCNRMAAVTLVPDDRFQDAYHEIYGPSRVKGDPRQIAEELATRFSVSREMIYRKFLDRELVSQQEYESASREWASQIVAKGKGGNPYRTWIAYLGNEYISLAFRRYYQNQITFEQLGEYLDIKPKNLVKLEDYLVRSNA